MSKPVIYKLTSVTTQTFSGYKTPGKALRAAGKWIDKQAEANTPWGVTVLGVHTYTDDDGTYDVTVTVEVS